MGEPRQKLDVSIAQVVGSALAAATAAVVASFVGVAGTVLGAAVVSVVATVGSAAYTHSLNRAKDRVRQAQARDRGHGEETGGSTTADPADALPTPPWWASWAVAGAAVAVFLLSMGAVSAFEIVAGHPLSSLLSRHHGQSGTTISRVFGGGGQTSTKKPSPGPSPATRVSPSAGPSATPTVGAEPSAAPRPSPSRPVEPARTPPAASPPAPSPSGP